MYEELVSGLRSCGEISSYKRDLMNKAADAIEELANNSLKVGSGFGEWISVTERLPEEKTYVLILADTIAGKMEKVSFLYKDSESRNCWAALDEYGKNIFDWQPTHWMPLPAQPKEKA